MQASTHPQPSPGYEAAFVESVLSDILRSGARCHGIAGLQGSGKSTLAAQVAALAARHGRHVAVLSIDDFYLDRPERLALARDIHPLLETRGPPGTHDVSLACRTIDALLAGESVPLPRFDKIDDVRLPRSRWPASGRADMVLVEGWCLCVPPQQADALATPVNALERDEDGDGRWRRHCNHALAEAYPPLWRRIGGLLFLQPPGFDVVPDWRWEQELSLQAGNPGRRPMSRGQVERFVQHYERVSRHALRTLPAIADRVAALDASRRPLG